MITCNKYFIDFVTDYYIEFDMFDSVDTVDTADSVDILIH